MAFQLISLPPDDLLAAFRQSIDSLLYPSETDATIEVELRSTQEIGEAISVEDIQRIYYPEDQPLRVETLDWAEANRLESNGTVSFFRDLANVITTYPNNEYYIHEPLHRKSAHQWREVRNLFFDNLVKQRWFRADLADPDGARADLYLTGRHLQIEIDADTNEIRTQLLDWVVIKTYVIET